MCFFKDFGAAGNFFSTSLVLQFWDGDETNLTLVDFCWADEIHAFLLLLPFDVLDVLLVNKVLFFSDTLGVSNSFLPASLSFSQPWPVLASHPSHLTLFVTREAIIWANLQELSQLIGSQYIASTPNIQNTP